MGKKMMFLVGLLFGGVMGWVIGIFLPRSPGKGDLVGD